MNETTALAVRETGGLQTINITDLIGHVKLVNQVMQQVMKKDEHYGVIPGCNKPSLYQAGAEKLALTFRLRPQFDAEVLPLAGDHREVRVKCTLYSIGSEIPCGDGLGICSTMESKYRYRKADAKCPNCGKETIRKSKAEYGGGWYCNSKSGGCGSKFDAGDVRIENENMGLVEHPNPADYWHTVEMMAAKRAYTSAVRRVTAASDIFTQDIEDEQENEDRSPKGGQHTAQAPQKTEPAKSETAPQTGTGAPTAYTGISVKEVHETQGKSANGKPWTAHFVTFTDGQNEMEGCTFDTNQGAMAKQLAQTGEKIKLTMKPGRKPGKMDIVSMEREGEPKELI